MNTLQLHRKSENINATGYHNTKPVFVKQMKATASFDFDKWDLDILTDYIITYHHSYVKKNAVIIYDLAQDVANQHGENHPELLKLTEVAFLFFHDLLNYLIKEEQILIPNIKKLFKKRNYKEKITYTTPGVIRETVKVMQKGHQATDIYITLFHKLTDDYKLPADACNSYKDLFMKMKEFEKNVVLHINLENNILFPRAIALDE